MIAALLLAAAPAAAPVTVSSAPPLACQAAEYAMRDQLATMNVRQMAGSPGPGPLGRDYIKASDRLAMAMREEHPDLERIGALWREVNRLKIEIGQRLLVNKTQCELEQLSLMPLDKQRSMLQLMSPMTQEERNKPGIAPVPPPTIRTESSN